MAIPNGPQFADMTDDVLYKAHGSALRRLNNLEARYGGVIPKDTSADKTLRPSDQWWPKKEKLINERTAIADEMHRRKQ